MYIYIYIPSPSSYSSAIEDAYAKQLAKLAKTTLGDMEEGCVG